MEPNHGFEDDLRADMGGLAEGDLPLPLIGSTTVEARPWAVDPEPTDLLALWPRRDAPTLAEIRAQLSKVVGTGSGEFDVISERGEEDEVHWLAILESQALPAPIIVWVEPARPMPDESPKTFDAASVKWVVGLETMLD